LQTVSRMNATHEYRLKNHLCRDCGADLPANETKQKCSDCRSRDVEKMRKKREEWKSDGICGICGDSAIPGLRYCESCKERSSITTKAWRARRKASPNCMYCNEPRWASAHSCKHHFVEKLINNYGCSKDHVPRLLHRFDDQGGACFYTGKTLIPGENASLDHYFCKAHHPHLVAHPDNLVWCDVEVNFMKRKLTPEQLVSFAKSIVERQASILAGVLVRNPSPLVPA
jgi:hypothetical protein